MIYENKSDILWSGQSSRKSMERKGVCVWVSKGGKHKGLAPRFPFGRGLRGEAPY